MAHWSRPDRITTINPTTTHNLQSSPGAIHPNASSLRGGGAEDRRFLSLEEDRKGKLFEHRKGHGAVQLHPFKRARGSAAVNRDFLSLEKALGGHRKFLSLGGHLWWWIMTLLGMRKGAWHRNSWSLYSAPIPQIASLPWKVTLTDMQHQNLTTTWEDSQLKATHDTHSSQSCKIEQMSETPCGVRYQAISAELFERYENENHSKFGEKVVASSRLGLKGHQQKLQASLTPSKSADARARVHTNGMNKCAVRNEIELICDRDHP